MLNKTNEEIRKMNTDELIALAAEMGKLKELVEIQKDCGDRGFIKAKSRFLHEICGVPYVEKNKKPSFAEKLAAAYAASAENDAIGEKLGFKKK